MFFNLLEVRILAPRKQEKQQNMTFEDIPRTLEMLLAKVDHLQATLDNMNPAREEERWLSVEELSAYHPDHPTVATIYSWVRDRRIPSYRSQKKLRFKKSEIDQLLAEGRQRTIAELDEMAQKHGKAFINNKKF